MCGCSGTGTPHRRGLPYTLDPRVLYRGYVANTLNMGLGTGFQFLVNGTVKSMLTAGNEHRQLAPSEQLGAGFVAGSTSALLISPTELLMIQQQRKGGGIFNAARIVLRTSTTTMFRGMVTTGAFVGTSVRRVAGMSPLRNVSLSAAMREGIYTAGYLGVGPSVREFIVATHGYSENAARVPAAILGGAFACLLSQCVLFCDYLVISPELIRTRGLDTHAIAIAVRSTRAKPVCKATSSGPSTEG